MPQLAPGEATLRLYRRGVLVGSGSIQVEQHAPGIFPAGVVRARTTCRVNADNGVRPGEVLEIYATGLGLGKDSPASLVQVQFGELRQPSLFAGALDWAPGVDQVNVVVPAGLRPGSKTVLRLQVGEQVSNPVDISVVDPLKPTAVLLQLEPTQVTLQAGAAPQKLSLHVAGLNGLCSLVRFRLVDPPAGIRLLARPAYPAQTVSAQLIVEQQVPAGDHVVWVEASAPGARAARTPLRLRVLPSTGPVELEIVSGGFLAGPLTRFRWAGVTIYETRGGGPGRGINVLVVDPQTGFIQDIRSFDTYASEESSAALARYLNSLDDGSLVALAVADDAAYRLTQQAKTTIQRLFGSRFIQGLLYQQSWALLGRKGYPEPIAEANSTYGRVILRRVLEFPLLKPAQQ